MYRIYLVSRMYIGIIFENGNFDRLYYDLKLKFERFARKKFFFKPRSFFSHQNIVWVYIFAL